ncbi:2-dehydropantoate 2-reductase [Sagittula marina]|uniref:2-dehydropantoate 2-reductase n=1 Tax=Sagittula marina TaxID=943940 RepID=A0A7W6GSI9_9RHOB|nr:ketopantoate reductase C-terminal domain-containing protein [Sagittula marina]MBB3985847.1 2-dehydropantoate 2-reductase [Sagittula marina]
MTLKIAVVGAGNIGTAMAALLGGTDCDLTVVARGARAAQVAANGLRLDDRGTLHEAHPPVVERLETPQDAVFLCVKSHQLPQAVALNAGGIGPDTLIIPMVNGLPFWFFAGKGEVPFVDPEGTLARHLRPEQVLGAVLLMTVRMEGDLALSTNTPTLSLGPAAVHPPGLVPLQDTLEQAGVRVDLASDIREKVLGKLLGNITTNPLSALLGCTLKTIGETPELGQLVCAVADPFRQWAAGQGVALPDNQWLLDLLIDAGDFPTSMLQDARAGRTLELDAIARAPLALAAQSGHPIPALKAILEAIDEADSLPLSPAKAGGLPPRLLANLEKELIQ